MKVALIQISTLEEQPEENLKKIIVFAKRAKNKDAKIIVFHEGALTNYVRDVDRFAQGVPQGPACVSMRALAKELDAFISFGLIEKNQEKRYITQVFFGPSGFIYKYRKTWLYSTRDKKKINRYRNEVDYFDAGSGPEIFQLGGLRCSCMICCDGNSKECLETIKQLRPDLVFFPNNREQWRADYREDIARFIGARLLVTNRVGTSWGERCAGGCSVYSKEGKLLAEANREGREEILFFDLKNLQL